MPQFSLESLTCIKPDSTPQVRRVSTAFLDECDAQLSYLQDRMDAQLELEDNQDRALDNLRDLADLLTKHPEDKDAILRTVNANKELESVLGVDDCNVMTAEGLALHITALLETKSRELFSAYITADEDVVPPEVIAPPPPTEDEPSEEVPIIQPEPDPEIPVVEPPPSTTNTPPVSPTVGASQEAVIFPTVPSSRIPLMLWESLFSGWGALIIEAYLQSNGRLLRVFGELKHKIRNGPTTDIAFKAKHATFGLLPKPAMEKYVAALVAIGESLKKSTEGIIKGNLKLDAALLKSKYVDLGITVDLYGGTVHKHSDLSFTKAPFGVLGYSKEDFARYAAEYEKAIQINIQLFNRIAGIRRALKAKQKEAEFGGSLKGSGSKSYHELRMQIKAYRKMLSLYTRTTQISARTFLGVLRKAV